MVGEMGKKCFKCKAEFNKDFLTIEGLEDQVAYLCPNCISPAIKNIMTNSPGNQDVDSDKEKDDEERK